MNTIREVTQFVPEQEPGKIEAIYCWEDLSSAYSEYFADGSWIFRGHDCLCRPFKSSFERALREFGIAKEAKTIEGNLLREFKRRAHHYISNPPDAHDNLQWLALMRHFGAPTRLLDWTYSFWVAAFFAVENQNPHYNYEPTAAENAIDKLRCDRPYHALWAIDTDWCRDAANSLLGKPQGVDWLHQDGKPSSFKRFQSFLDSKNAMAYPVNPYRLNERIVAQQGVFLCPGSLDYPFDDNLALLPPKSGRIRCVLIAPDCREDVVKELGRMNVNRAVLFPGLEGFANSLRLWMADIDRATSKPS